MCVTWNDGDDVTKQSWIEPQTDLKKKILTIISPSLQQPRIPAEDLMASKTHKYNQIYYPENTLKRKKRLKHKFIRYFTT